jgi:hypothetical protein
MWGRVVTLLTEEEFQARLPRWSSLRVTVRKMDTATPYGFSSNLTHIREIGAGWPVISWHGATNSELGASRVGSGLLRLPIEDRFGYKVEVPCWPVWPGFAINTIFYAAMLWLLWVAPGKIRRVIRIRGHRCPECGYQIAPGGGIGPVCSECGAALPAAWST